MDGRNQGTLIELTFIKVNQQYVWPSTWQPFCWGSGVFSSHLLRWFECPLLLNLWYQNNAVAPNARKFRRKVHHPKGAIHQCYNTNGWTKDVQSACWKNSKEISYIRVNQHSILRLGDSSSNVFIFLSLVVCECEAQARKPSHKKKLACLVYNWLLVSTHLKNISQIGSFPPKYGWK